MNRRARRLIARVLAAFLDAELRRRARRRARRPLGHARAVPTFLGEPITSASFRDFYARSVEALDAELAGARPRRRPAVRVEARVERRDFLYHGKAVLPMPGLEAIDLEPPAAGPEVALVFATAPGCDPVDEDLVRAELARLGLPVLATRTTGAPA